MEETLETCNDTGCSVVFRKGFSGNLQLELQICMKRLKIQMKIELDART